jgi:hypothetical protein
MKSKKQLLEMLGERMKATTQVHYKVGLVIFSFRLKKM